MKPRIDSSSSAIAKQLINEQIRAPRVQLITHEGTNVGIVLRNDALAVARDAQLDLVQLAPEGAHGVPVCKVMDYGKAVYSKKKKQTEAKKHQKAVQVKEIKVRPKIGEHDFLTKMRHALGFLKDGKHVKLTLMFRGREMATRQERGTELFDRVQQFFADQSLENLVCEKDQRAGPFWSRIYYVKR